MRSFQKPSAPRNNIVARWLLSFCLMASGCSSYSSATRKGFDAFGHRDFQVADEVYKGAEIGRAHV